MEPQSSAIARKIVETLQKELKDTSLGYALQHNPDLPKQTQDVVAKVLEEELK